jgi:FixJ family two-component response regulator
MSLYRRLRKKGSRIPVIFLTARADVPTAVQAMREGAFHFLVKPVGDQYLLDQVREAIALDRQDRRRAAENKAIAARFAGLSAREREVLTQIVAGQRSKAAASHLGITTKTVEFHRANIMRKVGAATVEELVHLLLRSGWQTQTAG